MLPIKLTEEEQYILSLNEDELAILGLSWGHQYHLEHKERVWGLYSATEAHKSISFPNICKGGKNQQIYLEKAIAEIYSMASAYLTSNCEYDFFEETQRKQIRRYMMDFDTLLHRRPVSRRLEPVATRYFEDSALLINALCYVDCKMR